MSKVLNILLVDDDEDEYVLLKGVFAHLPGQVQATLYNLDWVPSYDKALQVCNQKDYDLYLVDYHLGKFNGLDLMTALQARGCDAPVILLTGQGSYELDLAAMQQGAADYLLKDQVNEYLLERSIRYALERKSIQAELETRVQERTQALSESETRFRILADTTSAAIFIVQERKIRYANPAARFVTGYSPDELTQMELWQIAHPAYQATLKATRLGSAWAENVPARYEIKIIRKDGEERWLDVTAGAMTFEKQSAWLLTAFDITERDRAERALQKAKDELETRVAQRTAEIQAANQRLQTVMRSMPVGIQIADWNGDIIESNAIMNGLLGENLVPQNLADYERVRGWWADSGERLEAHDWPLAHAVYYGETVLGRVIDLQISQGQRKTILYSAVPIVGEEGKIAGGVGVAQDVTPQRRLEQQANSAAREAHQRAEELEGLHRATKALLSTLDLDQLLCQILDAAQSAIPGAENGLLYLMAPGTSQLQLRATLGFKDERIRLLSRAHGKDYPARAVRERRPLIIQDAWQEPENPWSPSQGASGELNQVRSIIIAPLLLGERVLGALALNASRPNIFSITNLRLLVSFAATTTAAIQNAMLHAEVKELAVNDPLTGQYNRRAFFDLGKIEMERFLRFGNSLVAVMMDMDNFKEINDTFGHATGDQILRMLAERCRDNLRDTDLFGRYGGDEFAILLPNTDLNTASAIARRILDLITQQPLLTEQGPVEVSISMGVAQAEKGDRELTDLLKSADHALYQAKSSGKNRVKVL